MAMDPPLQVYHPLCMCWQIILTNISGNVYTDAVTIGEITIPNQAVELAEKLSSSFQQDGGSDGLLGLAWPKLNTVTPKAQVTPVQNMIQQGIISLVRCIARRVACSAINNLSIASFHSKLG